MSQKLYGLEDVVSRLGKAEVLLSQNWTVSEAVRQFGISKQTYYRWKRECGGLDKTQAQKLKELENEQKSRFQPFGLPM